MTTTNLTAPQIAHLRALVTAPVQYRGFACLTPGLCRRVFRALIAAGLVAYEQGPYIATNRGRSGYSITTYTITAAGIMALVAVAE